MNVYLIGQTVTVAAAFSDPATNAGLSATILKLRLVAPSGAESDFSTGFANPAPGQYTMAVAAAAAGLWRCRWEASGGFAAACEGAFRVAPGAFPQD